MHDPMTQAFEIKYPWRQDPSQLWPKGYRSTFITIWHVDPETDGTDDSCGWFKRARHGDKETLAAVAKEFDREWDSSHSGWFEPEGKPRYSSIAITLGMFRRAAQVHFKFDWSRTYRFMRRNLYEIIQFAENNTDSMCDSITLRYGPSKRQDRISDAASTVYGFILRLEQPWYQHARWHVWHWHFQVHPWQTLRRWLFSRCCVCGKRFSWGYSPTTSSWDSERPKFFRGESGVYHSECSGMSPAILQAEKEVIK